MPGSTQGEFTYPNEPRPQVFGVCRHSYPDEPREVVFRISSWYKARPMNKQQAAEFLGVTTRAVERYTSQGKLSVRYEKGKTRSVAVYSEDELRALKSEIENPSIHRPAVDPLPAAFDKDSSQALIPTNTEQGLAEFVGFLRRASEAKESSPMPTISDIAQKIMLTLPEAALLTSLSRNHLRQAIEDKKLKARIIGRGWRVKRNDLDAYVKKL